VLVLNYNYNKHAYAGQTEQFYTYIRVLLVLTDRDVLGEAGRRPCSLICKLADS
jgi:hypothetical protein